MKDKELTKAEEQVMQYLWKLGKAFLKDIVEAYPEPKPAYTTISTVIRVLVKKEVIGFNTYGKTHEYYPLISKNDYFKGHMQNMIRKFFSGSKTKFASFFTDQEELDASELEEIKQMVEKKLSQIKKSENDDKH